MFQEVSLPQGWGTAVVDLPPPLLTDNQIRAIAPKDVRLSLIRLLARMRAANDPTLAPILRLANHAGEQIRNISSRANVVNLPPRQIAKETEHWQAIEQLAVVVINEASSRIKPDDAEIRELLRRWLVIRMSDIEEIHHRHTLDGGHTVDSGIIRDRRLHTPGRQ
jgi:hypothetical protein